MSGLLAGLLPLAVCLGIVAWGAVVLGARRWQPSAASAPATRQRAARLWLYAPLWVPGLLLLAVLARGLVVGDHCFDHMAIAHHHHLCLVHLPSGPEHALTWGLPLLILGPAGVLLAAAIRRALADRRRLRDLVGLSAPSPFGADVRLLDAPEPIALAVGGWRRSRRATILISRGLIDGVSPASLAAILAHERAHVARRDTLVGGLDHLAAALLPRAVARDLIDRISLAREQACDAVAARALADPIRVARALTEVLRLKLRPARGAASFGASVIEARIAWLLDPPAAPPARRWALPLTLLTLIAIGAGPLHTAAERLLVFLLH